MAFSIYILNLATVVFAGLQNAFFKYNYLANAVSEASGVILIILLIASFIFKRICEDDYLAEHFAYQFKTMMVMFLYALVLSIGVILALVFFDGFGKNALNSLDALVAPSLVLIGIIGIISFIIFIWFLYRNIKGLIYLSMDKDL
jgi:uncharacterized membrane protein